MVNKCKRSSHFQKFKKLADAIAAQMCCVLRAGCLGASTVVKTKTLKMIDHIITKEQLIRHKKVT